MTSLADELGETININFEVGGGAHPRNLLMMKYLRDEDLYSCDVDSGNSTAHSPDGPKSTSPVPMNMGNILHLNFYSRLHTLFKFQMDIF